MDAKPFDVLLLFKLLCLQTAKSDDKKNISFRIDSVSSIILIYNSKIGDLMPKQSGNFANGKRLNLIDVLFAVYQQPYDQYYMPLSGQMIAATFPKYRKNAINWIAHRSIVEMLPDASGA